MLAFILVLFTDIIFRVKCSDLCNIIFDEAVLGYELKFNVCNLKLTDQNVAQMDYYVVNDARFTHTSYYFNIAGTVLDYPDITCQNANASYKAGSSMIKIEGLTQSYKVMSDINGNPLSCYPTSGNTGSYYTPFSFQIIDGESTLEFGRPAYGFEYQYSNGFYNSTLDLNAIFNMVIVCDQEHWQNVPKTELVYYVRKWNMYYIKVFSVSGCPSECPIEQYSKKVCGGYSQGRCGIDYVTNKPKCFCLFGYSGPDCGIENFNKPLPPVITKDPPSSYAVSFDTINGSVTYDPLPFVLDTGYYDIVDENDDSAWETRIIFNIMKKIHPDTLPSSCQSVKPSFAYVLYANPLTGTECYSLGDQFQITIFDENQPASGVNFEYFNGSSCADGNYTRSFTVTALCSNQQSPSISLPRVFVNSQIYYADPKQCSIVAPLYMSPASCAYECVNELSPAGLYGACNQNGYCSYDPYMGNTRCLCYDGFRGPACGQVAPAPSPGPGTRNDVSPYVYIILANIIIIFLFIIVFSRLYRKWKQRMYLSIMDPLNGSTTDDNTSSAIDINENVDRKFLK